MVLGEEKQSNDASWPISVDADGPGVLAELVKLLERFRESSRVDSNVIL